MQFTRTLAVTLIASIIGIQAAHAQSLHKSGSPAEIPPASFAGNQYIDSRGCVFVRAGINGGTNWVPRVTRDRKLVCGFQPTLTAQQLQTAEQPRQVVKILPAATPEAVAPEAVGSKSPAPVRVVAARPVAVSPSPKSPPVMAKPVVLPRTVAMKPYEPIADKAPVMETSSKVLPERVAQRQPRRGDVVREGEIAGNVRVVPRHVYETRGDVTFKPPRGYRHAWTDDRLNPRRAEQTFDGKAKMDAIWTQTVPRRLIRLSATEE